MNLGRCPVCHSRISLEACVQDEAGREMLGLLAGLDNAIAAPLVGYLGLFRAPHRDLANDRALRLMREVLELQANRQALAFALAETVEALRAKGGAPLKNHNYLMKVVESAELAPAKIEGLSDGCGDGRGKQSASARAILNVNRLKFIE